MKLSFFGAARCVTGSCHCLDVNGKRILVDCGLQQGRDEIDNSSFPFEVGDIDVVLITHAHMDHSGRVPMLIRRGFRGRIITTRLTADLLDIMLEDSAHIQESDAEWKTRKAKRSGGAPVEPLYTVADARRVRDFLTVCEYGETVELCEGVTAEFVDAGHLLGSASVIVDAEEGGERRRIVFSGDLGNTDQPIIRDPSVITGADYVVMESTYGDHDRKDVWSYTDELAQIIDETIAAGGNVLIPAYAVGRTQEVLYFIHEIKERGMVRSDPDFPVYIDSPLAKRATTVFAGDLRGYLDDDAMELLGDTRLFSFPNLHMAETAEESKALNLDPVPKVIIAASGNCESGRIRHHLKHNLWRHESAVVLLGSQSRGTPGRAMLDGAKTVKILGEDIAVNAKVANFRGLNAHAYRSHLLVWIGAFTEQKPRHVFVVHGDPDVAPPFAEEVEKLGFEAHAPRYTEVYDLITNTCVEEGYQPRKGKDGAKAKTSAYDRLVSVGELVTAFIKRAKGKDNQTLANYTNQLKQLLEKWEKDS
ncbi:MAG: MBL fold metallo-hydrolase [Oscillibacter sp.]|nr:MBL fold metallo-hydrolase [Oscillibacter sp.]